MILFISKKENCRMKVKGLLLLALSIVMVSTGANAAMLTADCDGWSIGFSFTVPADIEYTVDLYQGGEIIWTYTETATVPAGQHVMYSGTWDMELCGDYSVNLEFNYNMGPGWQVLYYDTYFTCECEEPPTCTFTPGYWKNHPDAWPVDELTVGCVDYTKTELLLLLDLPANTGMTVKLFHHLVAAKLNVLWGSDDYIQSAIDAGDQFLCDHPLHSKLKGDLKTEAEMIKDELCAYNEIECEEEEDGDDLMSISAPARVDNAPAATVESSWGSIKKKNQ